MKVPASDTKHIAHVRHVLRAVDPNGRLLEISEHLAEVINSDSNAAEAFNMILKHVSTDSFDENARRIYDNYLVLYNRAIRAGGISDPEPFGGPDGFADAIAVGYLYAQDVLRAPGTDKLLTVDALRTSLPNAAKRISDMIDGEFLARLLLETRTRANRDPLFARAIESAKASLTATWPQFNGPSTIAMQAGGSGGGACQALFPGTGDKGCWIIGLIVVIVILVAK